MTQTMVNFISDVTYTAGSITAVQTTPRVFDFEISSTSQAYYISQMNLIQSILNNPNPQLSDVTTLRNAINDLIAWSEVKQVVNGQQVDTLSPSNPTFTPPNSPTVQLDTTMDQYMAQELEALMRTMRAAGFEPLFSQGGALAVQSIRSIGQNQTLYPTNSIIASAINAAEQARIIGNAQTQSQSIQQVLAVDYVSRGNEMLNTEMSNLRDAIDANQTTLSYLNSLQDLMNQKNPEKFVQQLASLFSSGGALISDAAYETYETQTFNRQLGVDAKFTDPSLSTYIASNPGALFIDAFSANILDPNSTTGATTIQTIISNLQALQNNIVAKGGSATSGLSQALQTVISDFQSVTNISQWVQDTTSGSAGDFQRHLSNAVVSSQSFNDTEREELSRVMFVFEEFYKSATGLLSRITQIIEKMASFISR